MHRFDCLRQLEPTDIFHQVAIGPGSQRRRNVPGVHRQATMSPQLIVA